MMIRAILLAASLGSAVRGGDDGLELIVDGGDRIARVRIVVAIDGSSADAARDDAFAALFRAADLDGDGALNEAEGRRLPAAFALRQGVPFLNPGFPPEWADLDADADKRATPAEVSGFYRRAGLGGPIVGLGRSPTSAALTDALLKRIDRSGDGRIDAEETRAAASSLLSLDRDGDELVAPAELAGRLPYPGSSGADLLAAPSVDHEPTEVETSAPLMVLPPGRDDVRWTGVLVDRRDRNRDGRLDVVESGLAPAAFDRLDRSGDRSLTAEELAAWRSTPPDAVWRATLDDGSAARFDLEVGRVRLSLLSETGDLVDWLEATRTRLKGRFSDADLDRDGFVENREAVAPDLAEIRKVIHHADRDGDGKLSSKELDAWLAVQSRIGRSHATLTALDLGEDLFALLDTDLDGALSIREIGGTARRLKTLGLVADDGRIDRSAAPTRLVIVLSRGRPRAGHRPRRSGPAWFLAMDRNGDGDVSRSEFNGPATLFESLDRDRDGLIDAAEAAKSPG